MSSVEFIEKYTNKGKPAAILNGFAYIKDVDLANEKVRYKCIHYRTCKSYIWVKNGIALIMLNGTVLGREHNHEIEPEKIEARKRLKTFKSLIEEQPHANISALEASTRDCEVVVANAMPSIDLLKRTG